MFSTGSSGNLRKISQLAVCLKTLLRFVLHTTQIGIVLCVCSVRIMHNCYIRVGHHGALPHISYRGTGNRRTAVEPCMPKCSCMAKVVRKSKYNTLQHSNARVNKYVQPAATLCLVPRPVTAHLLSLQKTCGYNTFEREDTDVHTIPGESKANMKAIKRITASAGERRRGGHSPPQHSTAETPDPDIAVI